MVVVFPASMCAMTPRLRTLGQVVGFVLRHDAPPLKAINHRGHRGHRGETKTEKAEFA